MIAKSTTLAFMFVPAAAAILCCGPSAHSQGMDSPEIDADSVIRAFAASCDGYSSDELLVRDDLRAAFLRQLTHDTPLGPDAERDAFLKLLQLRKAGKLTVRATRRGQPVAPSVWPVAEIAARVVTDRHRISCDMMLADPRFRTEFLQEARKIAPKVTAPAIGKGVLALRKKRALRPELVLRVVSWEKVVETHTLAELRQRLAQDEISHHPGIYLFRSRDRYLYIGESEDLAVRLSEHVQGSDRESLARYLAADTAEQVTVEVHAFAPDSPASRAVMRRAYESELIRSRNPLFNVRP
jgi:hypothetical protein